MLIFSCTAGISLERTSESRCVFRERMWSPFYRRAGKISEAPLVVHLKQDAGSLTHPFHNITMWQGQDVERSLRLKIIKWHCLMQRHSCTSEQDTDFEMTPGCFWWHRSTWACFSVCETNESDVVNTAGKSKKKKKPFVISVCKMYLLPLHQHLNQIFRWNCNIACERSYYQWLSRDLQTCLTSYFTITEGNTEPAAKMPDSWNSKRPLSVPLWLLTAQYWTNLAIKAGFMSQTNEKSHLKTKGMHCRVLVCGAKNLCMFYRSDSVTAHGAEQNNHRPAGVQHFTRKSALKICKD